MTLLCGCEWEAGDCWRKALVAFLWINAWQTKRTTKANCTCSPESPTGCNEMNISCFFWLPGSAAIGLTAPWFTRLRPLRLRPSDLHPFGGASPHLGWNGMAQANSITLQQGGGWAWILCHNVLNYQWATVYMAECFRGYWLLSYGFKRGSEASHSLLLRPEITLLRPHTCM